jgi:hypothetical protein
MPRALGNGSTLRIWSTRGLVPVLAGLATALSGCASDPDAVTAVFPIPGSHLASPQTQIVFRGAPITKLGRIDVTGSKTGRHTGRLMADSDGRGGSFIPAKPFSPGERVTVTTRARLGRIHVRPWHFFIAHPAGPIPNTPLPPAPRLPGDVLSFRSRPDLQPVSVEIVKRSRQESAGDLFLTPQQGPVQNGPMILTSSGQLVWFKPVPKGDLAADFRVQHYHGKPVLTWWQGYTGAGVGVGEDLIYDSSYQLIGIVRAANGLGADLHEFQLTRQGTALITAYYPVYWDGRSVKGPRRMLVLDCVVQEIDVKTGLVLFQWNSLDHVPLADTYEPRPKGKGQPFDYFHINSIQKDRRGDLVISARNTWAAYKVDPNSGRTLWTLGGKHSTFRLGPGAAFAFQHDVRVRSDEEGDDTVTVFDDGAGPPVVRQQSRGLTLHLDRQGHTARLVKEDEHPPPLLASFEGNLQQLANGDQFLGWGQQPYFTEFDRAGQVVFDGRFVDANSTYRAYRFLWRARPASVPVIAAIASGGTTTAYVSWNGATAVAAWRILGGNDPARLRPVATVPRRGFETQAQVPDTPYLAAQALDRRGRVLSVSRATSPN